MYLKAQRGISEEEPRAPRRRTGRSSPARVPAVASACQKLNLVPKSGPDRQQSQIRLEESVSESSAMLQADRSPSSRSCTCEACCVSTDRGQKRPKTHLCGIQLSNAPAVELQALEMSDGAKSEHSHDRWLVHRAERNKQRLACGSSGSAELIDKSHRTAHRC